MIEIEIVDAAGARRLLSAPDDCMVGKAAHSEVRLDGWRVAREHAHLFRTPAGVLLEDMGAFAGVTVNGRRVDGHHGPLCEADVIGIGPYRLRVLADAAHAGDAAPPVQAAHPASRSDTAAHRNQLAAQRLHASRLAAEKAQREALRDAGAADRGAAGRGDAPAEDAGTTDEAARPALHEAAARFAMVVLPEPGRTQLEFDWRRRIHAALLETMDLRRHDVHRMSDERLRAETESLIAQIVRERDADIPAELDRALLVRQVLDEAVGLGPLEELLADESVTEIMVNRFDQIYVERAGRLRKHPLVFTGDRAVLGVIERIVAPLGRRIDEASPMVDARLKDGSRVNAIIPPLALKGPVLTIRKFARRKLDADDLVRLGSISAPMARFLEVCVASRKNVIVSGGTGSGKTTLLNILSNFIPPGERVITVEDAAELQLHHEHLISLEARPANVEGKGAVPIRDLVRNTLRMRPDRIVVGECRGPEALDMLQAMNTGHEGSLTTLHANSPRDALARLETMVLMAGMELPLVAIREQIASAVDIIVQQTRFACGSRLVTSIAEVAGIESGKIQLQELFRFVARGYGGAHGRMRGHFTGCDLVPTFYEALRAVSGELDMSIFRQVAPDDEADAQAAGGPAREAREPRAEGSAR